MMSSRLFKVAGAAAVLQGGAHLAMVLAYTPTHGLDEIVVIRAMQSNYFLFAGAPRSYWGFYLGYAVMSAFTCVVEGALLWQLGRFTNSETALSGAVARVLIVFNLGHAILAARYFFPLPATLDLLIALLIGLGLAVGRKTDRMPTRLVSFAAVQPNDTEPARAGLLQ